MSSAGGSGKLLLLQLLNWVRATPDRPFMSSKSSSQTRLIGHDTTSARVPSSRVGSVPNCMSGLVTGLADGVTNHADRRQSRPDQLLGILV